MPCQVLIRRDMDIVFEKATKLDVEQLVKLRVAYLLEDYGDLNEKELAMIERDLPDYFLKNLNKNIFAYIGRSEEDIVACALLLFVEKPMSPAFINGKTGMVLNVYTKPQYRHHGYAKRLMNMLLEDAVNMGLCVVELKATEQGYSLYQSIGFADSISQYHQMEWRNESAEKNTL